MQISRYFLVACAAACATTLSARGGDTPAQIKAREALRQKMQEAPAQPSTARPTAASRAEPDSISKARDALREKMKESPAAPAPALAAPPEPAPAPAPVAPPEPAPAPVPAVQAPPPVAAPVAPPVANTDVPVPPPAVTAQQADSDAISKAREAVREKIQESPSTPPPVVPPPVVATPAPAPVAPPPVSSTAPASPAVAAASAQPADSESIAKARDAVRQTISEGGEPGPKADPQAIANAREAVRQRMQSITYSEPTSRGGNPASVNFPPLEGPPLPISSQQQQRLSELLQRYRADQVTPEQYQAERAKILAGSP